MDEMAGGTNLIAMAPDDWATRRSRGLEYCDRDTGGSARVYVRGDAKGAVLRCNEGLSFWGGVDPRSGRIVDAHHPDHGASVAGKFLLMPTSRGSCSGSGVLLELSLAGLAPAALVFCETEEVLTLGALVSDRIFGRPIPVLSLPPSLYEKLASTETAEIAGDTLQAGPLEIELRRAGSGDLQLSEGDRALLAGDAGPAMQLAMDVLCQMASAAGARELTDVTRAHIDGCILAHDANLIFAEKLADLGARVAVPTTINAISVDRENWRSQGVPAPFGDRASRLADAYVRMGARPTFTCAPYLLQGPPEPGERLGWSESNAVLYANSVLGARSPKHPDYLDLFIAMTGRAPATGVYTDVGRAPRRLVEFNASGPDEDESFWPLAGWLTGRLSPDRIPVVTGLEHLSASPDDLKALCAAFATTSGAPMLHIAGHTPESHLFPGEIADRCSVETSDLASAWRELNRGPREIDLVAIGSPHASVAELRRIIELFAGRHRSPATQMIVTIGRDSLRDAARSGLVRPLEDSGARLIPDICWCSITEPVFPPGTRGLITNSGKYAHYAHGLCGLHARFGSLSDCVEAAVSGLAPQGPPEWLSG